jgi:hypothetical protein
MGSAGLNNNPSILTQSPSNLGKNDFFKFPDLLGYYRWNKIHC